MWIKSLDSDVWVNITHITHFTIQYSYPINVIRSLLIKSALRGTGTLALQMGLIWYHTTLGIANFMMLWHF